MKLLILAFVCLNAAYFVCSAGERTVGDRLALKRRFQLQQKSTTSSPARDVESTRLESSPESPSAQNQTEVIESTVEKIDPITDVESDGKSLPENVTHTTTATPDVSSSPLNNETTKKNAPIVARLPKLRPTALPLPGRSMKTTTVKISEEDVTPVTKAPKLVKKPTEGPKALPVIKPFDPTRRPTFIALNRQRPSAAKEVVSIKPFRSMLKSNENVASNES